MKLYALLNIILCFSVISTSYAQDVDVSIEFGAKTLNLDEPLTISLVLHDTENRPSVIFPEIEGLEKRSKSATSSISTIEGKKIFVQTITQQYFAIKEGVYEIPSFTLIVNGARVKSEETSVVFNLRTSPDETVANADDARLIPEIDENSKDIFLSVQSDKKEVFLREGFALRVSLFVAENAPVEMEFYQFNTQLQNILKKLRPIGCWEENVGIEEISKRSVKIQGRNYNEYSMYRAQLFPLTLQNINFPAVTLDMLVTENSSAESGATKVIKSFRSRSWQIVVKPLPAHPLKDQVAVGEYHLVEKLSSEMVYPGESVRYVFKIEGKGNIAAIPVPEIQSGSSFDFYPPDISQVIQRSYQRVTGEKTFDYFIVPRLDGTFPLGRYFQWIYFNPVAMRYDTLKATKTLQVRGEDYKLGNISLSSSLGLYDNLEKADSSKENFDFKNILKDLTNAIVILLLIAMIWVFSK